MSDQICIRRNFECSDEAFKAALDALYSTGWKNLLMCPENGVFVFQLMTDEEIVEWNSAFERMGKSERIKKL